MADKNLELEKYLNSGYNIEGANGEVVSMRRILHEYHEALLYYLEWQDAYKYVLTPEEAEKILDRRGYAENLKAYENCLKNPNGAIPDTIAMRFKSLEDLRRKNPDLVKFHKFYAWQTRLEKAAKDEGREDYLKFEEMYFMQTEPHPPHPHTIWDEGSGRISLASIDRFRLYEEMAADNRAKELQELEERKEAVEASLNENAKEALNYVKEHNSKLYDGSVDVLGVENVINYITYLYNKNAETRAELKEQSWLDLYELEEEGEFEGIPDYLGNSAESEFAEM